MTIEQRVAVLEEIFAKLRDYYILLYSGEEIDALLASAGVPIGITKEYDSVSAMNDDFSSTDVARGQFVLILPTDTSSENYGKVYLKGSANWVYVFTLTSLTAIKGPQGPAGKTGAKGADGADGKNFMVLGYYETLSALNAAVPSPGTGDTYGVGTEPPYAFYMYDPTISNWRYVGNLQGPAGPTGGEDNFVRYDAAQSLTDEQKAQARTNIGADTVQGTVRYDAAQSLTDAQKTQARNNISAMQGIESTDHPGCNYVLNGSTVEWINPPMQLGVEYRTTERYKGKPVYIKAVDTGALPNATYKFVTASFPNANAIVDYGGEAYQDGSHFIPLPCLRYGSDAYSTEKGVQVTINNSTEIVIATMTNFSSFTSSSVWVKYTKSTD